MDLDPLGKPAVFTVIINMDCDRFGVHMHQHCVLDSPDSYAACLLLNNCICDLARFGKTLFITLYCKVWVTRTLMWGLMESSTFNLMAISCGRFMAIVHPMWYRVYFTNSKANIIAVCIWVLGVSFVASIMVPTTAMMDGLCIISRSWPSLEIAQAVGSIQVFINLVMPALVHFFCYARILSVLRRRVTRRITPKDVTTSTTQLGETRTANMTRTTEAGAIHTLGDDADSTRGAAVSVPSTSGANVVTNLASMDSADLASRSPNKQPNSSETRNEKAKGNVVKTLAIVTACYFICWMPNKIYITLYLLGVVSTLSAFHEATVTLAFINCCINPIIFVGKCHPFKTGLSMLLKRR